MEVNYKSSYCFSLGCLFPLYMGLAAQTKDSIERFKFVITSILSSFIWTNNFNKPVILNYQQYILIVKSHTRRNIRSNLQ